MSQSPRLSTRLGWPAPSVQLNSARRQGTGLHAAATQAEIIRLLGGELAAMRHKQEGLVVKAFKQKFSGNASMSALAREAVQHELLTQQECSRVFRRCGVRWQSGQSKTAWLGTFCDMEKCMGSPMRRVRCARHKPQDWTFNCSKTCIVFLRTDVP